MRTGHRIWLWLAVLAMGAGLLRAPSAMAEKTVADVHAAIEQPNPNLHKLGRGLANTFTGLGEIPRVANQIWHDEGPLAGSSAGLTKGVWRALWRTGAGIYEVATFWLEVPKGFAPLIRPEFVYTRGDWADE